jgi:hypothetical protein
MRRGWVGLSLGAAVVSGLVGCGGGGSTGGPASAASARSASAAVTPTDSELEVAASHLRQLLEEYQTARDRVDLRGNSTFAEWHHSAVVYAQTCHTLAAGLQAETWPREAQPLAERFAAMTRADCAAYDLFVPAGSFAEYKAAGRKPRFVNREQVTETKLALYAALGI